MKRCLASALMVAICALAWQRADACRYCQGSADYSRYGNQDPMNAMQFDSLVEPYRDMGAPMPKPNEIVTSKSELAQAAAMAVPQPGAALAPEIPNSFRSRLLRENGATAGAVPVIANSSGATTVKPLGKWTSHVLDVSILGALLGVVLFFRRGTRREAA